MLPRPARRGVRVEHDEGLGRVRVAVDGHEAAPPQVVRGRESGLSGADDGDLHLGCIHMHGNPRAGSGIPADSDG